MKRVLTLLTLVGLIGCAPAPEPVVPEVFRDQSAQIASQTDVTAQRMAGDWVVRQSFATKPYPTAGFELSVLPDGALQMSFPPPSCVGAVDCAEVSDTLVLLLPTGPGRWTPVDPPRAWPDADLWVMWMDFDSRTAAIGTPSGQFGWIMDRNPTGGEDRIIAARDIMDWFGYDPGQLQEVAR